MIPTLIKIWNCSYISVFNLRFEGANDKVFDLQQSTAITIKNCSMQHTGNTAIKGYKNRAILIDSCEIVNAHNDGIYLSETNSSVISNSKILNSGIVPGMGGNGDGTCEAIILEGSLNIIRNNVIDSVGY